MSNIQKQVTIRICQECQRKMYSRSAITNGSLAYSGKCGKSIIIYSDGRIHYSDEKDCPRCPTFGDPVREAEKSLERIRGKGK